MYNELIEALRCDKECYGDCNAEKPCEYQRGASVNYCDYSRLLRDAADAIEALQAQMPKRGEWIRHGTDEDEFCYYECPLCGFIGIDWNYCPNCGARMRGEHDAEI